MAAHLVNLDALIVREDFMVSDAQNSATPPSLSTNIKLSELEPTSLAYQALRKPDFQRETASWEPQKVMEFVRSFVDGDLIPSLILWRSDKSRNVFVIDGAHRLSALIAWVHDDYGDGAMSRAFFNNIIPPEQLKAAKLTRQLIADAIGSYAAIKSAALHSHNPQETQVLRGKNLGYVAFEVQWVRGGAEKAETSFFKINQEATPINETELRILQSRRKPHALAARALIHAGTGHKYWSAFAKPVQTNIETIARNVYDILFDPPLEVPIKTLDLPVAGRGYSATSVQLIFDFVNFVNRKHTDGGKIVPDDQDGDGTLAYLESVQKIACRLSGNNPESLGLHPAVYFYSATGRYQPASFLAVALLIESLEEKKRFFEFTSVRGPFEDFLVEHRFFINQIVRKYGAGLRALPAIHAYFEGVIGFLENDAKATNGNIIAHLQTLKHLDFLNPTEEYEKAGNKRFSSAAKSGAFLRDALENSVRCEICNARVHKKAISVDHIIRKADGGSGDMDNAQLTHPYCNTGYKEKLVRQQHAVV